MAQNSKPNLSENAETPAPVASGKANSLKTIVLGLFLAAILLILGIWLFNKNHQTSTSSVDNKVANVAQVSIESTGFIPQTISVKAGTQVTWTNNDQVAHQVAADPYPKDDSIPDFDSTEVLQPNDTTSFSFDSPGTYHLHDELNPQTFNATVVVK